MLTYQQRICEIITTQQSAEASSVWENLCKQYTSEAERQNRSSLYKNVYDHKQLSLAFHRSTNKKTLKDFSQEINSLALNENAEFTSMLRSFLTCYPEYLAGLSKHQKKILSVKPYDIFFKNEELKKIIRRLQTDSSSYGYSQEYTLIKLLLKKFSEKQLIVIEAAISENFKACLDKYELAYSVLEDIWNMLPGCATKRLPEFIALIVSPGNFTYVSSYALKKMLPRTDVDVSQAAIALTNKSLEEIKSKNKNAFATELLPFLCENENADFALVLPALKEGLTWRETRRHAVTALINISKRLQGDADWQAVEILLDAYAYLYYPDTRNFNEIISRLDSTQIIKFIELIKLKFSADIANMEYDYGYGFHLRLFDTFASILERKDLSDEQVQALVPFIESHLHEYNFDDIHNTILACCVRPNVDISAILTTLTIILSEMENFKVGLLKGICETRQIDTKNLLLILLNRLPETYGSETERVGATLAIMYQWENSSVLSQLTTMLEDSSADSVKSAAMRGLELINNLMSLTEIMNLLPLIFKQLKSESGPLKKLTINTLKKIINKWQINTDLIKPILEACIDDEEHEVSWGAMMILQEVAGRAEPIIFTELALKLQQQHYNGYAQSLLTSIYRRPDFAITPALTHLINEMENAKDADFSFHTPIQLTEILLHRNDVDKEKIISVLETRFLKLDDKYGFTSREISKCLIQIFNAGLSITLPVLIKALKVGIDSFYMDEYFKKTALNLQKYAENPAVDFSKVMPDLLQMSSGGLYSKDTKINGFWVIENICLGKGVDQKAIISICKNNVNYTSAANTLKNFAAFSADINFEMMNDFLQIIFKESWLASFDSDPHRHMRLAATRVLIGVIQNKQDCKDLIALQTELEKLLQTNQILEFSVLDILMEIYVKVETIDVIKIINFFLDKLDHYKETNFYSWNERQRVRDYLHKFIERRQLTIADLSPELAIKITNHVIPLIFYFLQKEPDAFPILAPPLLNNLLCDTFPEKRDKDIEALNTHLTPMQKKYFIYGYILPQLSQNIDNKLQHAEMLICLLKINNDRLTHLPVAQQAAQMKVEEPEVVEHAPKKLRVC